MSERSLQISEQFLRLVLAVSALALAAWIAAPQPAPRGANLKVAFMPKPGMVKEW